MREADKQEFGSIWKAAWELHGRTVTTGMLQIAFQALMQFEIDEVKAALTKHIRDPERGQFPPKPADIIAMMQGHDGRPSPDEAWAICPQSELQTVVWTSDIKQAYQVALPLIEAGDRVAARMAFIDAYRREVKQSRECGDPVQWEISLGHDRQGREPALQVAIAQGRITHDEVLKLLPEFGQVQQENNRLLTGPVSAEKIFPEKLNSIREDLKQEAQTRKKQKQQEEKSLSWNDEQEQAFIREHGCTSAEYYQQLRGMMNG